MPAAPARAAATSTSTGRCGARREEPDVGQEPERDRWDDLEPAADLALRRVGRDLDRLVRDRQGLAADLEDLLDGKRGGILGRPISAGSSTRNRPVA